MKSISSPISNSAAVRSALLWFGVSAVFFAVTPVFGQVRISQIYGAGGNAGATLKSDYVELFNAGQSTASLTGLSIQYAATTGSTWSRANLSGSIPAGGYFLVRITAAGANGTDITPDLDGSGSISMAAGAGKVALMDTQTTITNGTVCPTTSVLDFVPYGTGTNCSNPTATINATLAAFRANGGCTDTDNSTNDFSTATPAPRNASSAVHVCSSPNPSATGTANPSPVVRGNNTTLSATVTLGTSPTSTTIAVQCNLSAIDGITTALNLSGTLTSLSAVYAVPGSATPNTYSIPCVVSDDQSRTGNFNISLQVVASAAPTASGTATSAAAGTNTTLNATVTLGVNPTSVSTTVTCDLTGVGGNVTPLTGTLTAKSLVYAVPVGTAATTYSLPCSVSDDQARSTNFNISLTITGGSTPPTGVGSAVPSSVPAGGTTQLTVNVTPGANPASTGLSVTGDLSSIGGSSVQAFQASGNTFTFSATVDPATTQGAKSLPFTVSDAEGRSSGSNISLTVTAPLANSTVVISQIYGGGGNSGATYTNDYVQLYNRSNSTVDLSGWSLQYSPATGTGDWTGRQPLGGTIAAGQYYLISLASGGANGSALPAANVSGGINISQTVGKLAVADNGDLLTGQCPDLTHVKDLVGYGSTANCFEGSGAAIVSSALTTTALFRLGAGFIDTNDNKLDFNPGSPSPLTTSPIVPIPAQVFGTYPVSNGSNIPRDATIEVTFTAAVTVDSVWFDITCATTGAHNDVTEAPDGINRWITPNVNFTAGESCTVSVFKTKVHDANNASPPQNYIWSFTVASGAAPPEPATIHLLMGNPTSATADINQPANYLMSKPEYAMSYNRDLGRPNWVSWHLTNDWIPVSHPARVDTFRPDPEVPAAWYRVQSFDFSGSGFDRGHLTPNADRESSIPVNQATFLMSNMMAQAPANNQGPWGDLEEYLRTLVRSTPANEVYIVAGPAGTGGSGSNGSTTNTLANGHVTVPAMTWKVALVLSDNGTNDDISRVNCSTTALAVIMPNTQSVNSDWHASITTVNNVETLTGYHFFTNLPQPIQNCIKAGLNGNNPKNNQTITFPPFFGAPGDVQLQATASSGLAVTYSVVSGPATVNGATLHITGAGAVTVKASQAGDVNYNSAPDVSLTVNVVIDVTAQTTITPGTVTFNRGTGAYTGTYSVKNTSGSAISAPLQFVLTSVPGGAVVISPTGTVPGGPYAGAPYITIPGPSPLAPGASVNVQVTYKNPAGPTWNAVPKVLSGAF